MSRSTDTLIKVAVGILINSDNQVLVALRPVHNPYGGLWEFPGGKFEKDETPLEALKRELFEEIGIVVIKASPLICIEHNYGALSVELDTWHIESWEGTPYGRENQEILWVDHQKLSQLDFPDGNREIVKKVIRVLQDSGEM